MSDAFHPRFWVVVPAAGVGSRMRADRPKQYLQLAGRTILEHTLDCFLDHPGLNGLVVSVAAGDPYWLSLGCATDSRVKRAVGGAERAGYVDIDRGVHTVHPPPLGRLDNQYRFGVCL